MQIGDQWQDVHRINPDSFLVLSSQARELYPGYSTVMPDWNNVGAIMVLAEHHLESNFYFAELQNCSAFVQNVHSLSTQVLVEHKGWQRLLESPSQWRWSLQGTPSLLSMLCKQVQCQEWSYLVTNEQRECDNHAGDACFQKKGAYKMLIAKEKVWVTVATPWSQYPTLRWIHCHMQFFAVNSWKTNEQIGSYLGPSPSHPKLPIQVMSRLILT